MASSQDTPSTPTRTTRIKADRRETGRGARQKYCSQRKGALQIPEKSGKDIQQIATHIIKQEKQRRTLNNQQEEPRKQRVEQDHIVKQSKSKRKKEINKSLRVKAGKGIDYEIKNTRN